MFEVSLLFCFLVPLLLIIFKFFQSIVSAPKSDANLLPKSNPTVVNYLSIFINRDRLVQWTADVVRRSPNFTIVVRRPFGGDRLVTANPAIVQHILMTKFSTYPKGDIFHATFSDLLGDGIFNTDGDEWKLQRQLSSYEFSKNSLRHFVEHVVDTELNERLLPVLATAAANDTVLDLQDILQRFTFDNICKITFGYDPDHLTPTLPQTKFAVAFEEAVRISTFRYTMLTPLLWKVKRFFNIGLEKQLKAAVSEVRQFALKIVHEKKRELSQLTNKSSIQSVDLLSRFITSGNSDERFLTDIVISFIIAGRDTTSAALTWFFWLLYKNPTAEIEVVKEIDEKLSESSIYDEVKDMVYTHASLCETMRFYPPVPVDAKMAIDDDVLPDGTVVKKGTMVAYHTYAMGRMDDLWGGDWMEFRPERWLEKDETTEKVKFRARDPYVYPVFQAGPRICLGRDMAFLQMKRVAAGVLRQFKVVPVVDDGGEPSLATGLTLKMKDGFPVKIKKRDQSLLC